MGVTVIITLKYFGHFDCLDYFFRLLFILLRNKLEEINQGVFSTLTWKTLILVPLKQYFLIMQVIVFLALSALSPMDLGAINSALLALIIN